MVDTPCIKGQSYNLLKKYIIEKLGADAWQKILQEINSRDREIASKVILDVSWQPEKPFLNLLNASEKKFGRDDYKLCRSIGNYSAKEGVSRFYKIFIRFGDPGYVIGRAANFWNQIHNHGRLEIRRTTPVSALGGLHGYKTPDKAFCHYLMGYCEGVLEMSGAKNISISEIRCVCDGNEYCEFIGEWK